MELSGYYFTADEYATILNGQMEGDPSTLLDLAVMGGSVQALAAWNMVNIGGEELAEAIRLSETLIPDDGFAKSTLFDEQGGIRYTGGRFSVLARPELGTKQPLEVTIRGCSREDCLDSARWHGLVD